MTLSLHTTTTLHTFSTTDFICWWPNSIHTNDHCSSLQPLSLSFGTVNSHFAWGLPNRCSKKTNSKQFWQPPFPFGWQPLFESGCTHLFYFLANQFRGRPPKSLDCSPPSNNFLRPQHSYCQTLVVLPPKKKKKNNNNTRVKSFIHSLFGAFGSFSS